MDNLEERVKKGFKEAAEDVIKYFGWDNDKITLDECNKCSSYKEMLNEKNNVNHMEDTGDIIVPKFSKD
jgi:Zn ribbon nucleic-acid-binding protein